jgi:hypothetical protein
MVSGKWLINQLPFNQLPEPQPHLFGFAELGDSGHIPTAQITAQRAMVRMSCRSMPFNSTCEHKRHNILTQPQQ